MLDQTEDRVEVAAKLIKGGELPQYHDRSNTGDHVNFHIASIMTDESGDGAHGWWYTGNTVCELERRFGGLRAADVWLDPDFPAPKAGDTAIHLRVHERACAGGSRPTERIRVGELERSADEVRVAIGVEPVKGGATCPGNPTEPYALSLDERLGSERLLNVGVYPPRPFDAKPDRRY